jgi:proline racemase
VHKSIIGSEFRGVIEQTVDVAGQAGIVPSITGRAWITAFHHYVLDPSDPFPTGYRIGDTWPMG